MYRFICLFLLSLCLRPLAIASPVPLQPQEHGRSLQPYVELLEDRSGSATLEDALKTRGFAPVTQAQLIPGYSRSAFWLRTVLYNPTMHPHTVWLEVGIPRLQEVTLYQFTDQHWQLQQAGTKLAFAARPLDTATPVFPIILQPGESKPVLWRVASATALSIAPRIWTPELFRANEATANLVHGLYLGPLAVLGLYSLMLFLSLKQRGYAFHSASTLAFVVYELCMSGIGFRYLWPEAGTWATRLISLSMSISLICSLLFFRELLDTRKRMPRYDTLILALMTAPVISAVLSQLIDYTTGARLGTQLGLLFTGILPLFCFWTLVRGPAISWAYPMAMFMIALGNLPRVLEALGLRTPDQLSAYGTPLAGVLCSMLLLIAFTQQVQRIQQQKDEATSLLLALQEQEMEALEQLVAVRTQEINRALESARQANQAKNTLLAHISHDLRAPASVIIGYARLLPAQYRHAIEENAQHQLELIDELVDYSCIEHGEVALSPRSGYWYTFIDGIASDTRQLAAQHGNRFELHQAMDLPPVLKTDYKRLRQVLSNLLSNASKFTEQGLLSLHIERLGKGDQPSKVSLIFRVDDNGIGMSAATQFRLFQPFKRGDNSAGVQGSGLGLFISQRLVHKLGGDLTVQSQLGQGSSFSFILQLDIGAETELLAKIPASPAPLTATGRSYSILVVDDIADSRALTAHWLQVANHQAYQAKNVEDALRLLTQYPIDAVISEQHMLQCNGWDLLSAMRAEGMSQAVLLYSAIPEQPPADISFRFDLTLRKPAEPHQLLEAIEALQARQALTPPTSSELEQLKILIDSGQIGAIETWAASLARTQPACRNFAIQVMAAAVLIDIDALRCLLVSDST
ncbi:hybrid sensor histidine kinase/response regulator [Aquitalea aquatilis]|uniref:hybrid sensor histidine kinase/response regulator n=1 Tax=Aquitalea aquatilis TaxID=1537400 RepID=UPI00143E0A25|nr:hybrid sensor histidine kinase/response regulator [Aquitalea aquatilis]